MPFWTIKENWKGQDAFIIGGGHSLRGFDWTLLHRENTIGCNTAFRLGEKVCKICVFGDPRWWEAFKEELQGFKGAVFTNSSCVLKRMPSWVWYVTRFPDGLHKDALGWNGHTGSTAINLAFLLGVKRVYLLGFDMFRTKKHSNWHDEIVSEDATQDSSYVLFRNQNHKWIRAWHKKFRDREIWNVTNESRLEGVPKIPVDEFWSKRKVYWDGEDNG